MSEVAARKRDKPIDVALARVGDWLMRHQRIIQRSQWFVVLAYVGLLVVPALMPLPPRAAHMWTNLTLFAQFVFWGLWWPFVLLSMVIVGRAWCGLLCPEGALSEAVSARGRGLAVPRWLQWRGWPFVAFSLTTIYGQMTSVYQYPGPALVVLGGSTVAAMAVGYLWGRHKRVWCRFLCPVTGVFGLLSKLAPFYFRVDREAWHSSDKPRGVARQMVNCAPLVPLPIMRGSSACHMCGRCSGFRGAITLSRRSPNAEIVEVSGDRIKPWETALIVFGLLGLAAGAFHWTTSAKYVAVRQWLAEWLVDRDVTWPLEPVLPWFVLTNYPALNDTMTPLDGVVLVGYIISVMVLVGVATSAFIVAASIACGRWSQARAHHFAQALIPLAGCGVFLGLFSLTTTMLKAEGIELPFVGALRAAMLGGASLWAVWLSWRISWRYTKSAARAIVATLCMAGAVSVGLFTWASLFWKFL